MAGMISLTNNAIARMCNGELKSENEKPIVQVVDIKLLTSGGQQNSSSSERYRMLLSDGFHLQQGMLSTQMNHLVHQQSLQKGSIVELSQFVSQLIQTRKIIIIVDLNVILEKCDPIGDPKMYGQGGNGPASALAQQVKTSVPEHSSVVHPGASPANPVPHAISTVNASLQNNSLSTPNVTGRGALHNLNPDSGSHPQSYCNLYTGHPGSREFSKTNGSSLNSNTDFGPRNPMLTATTRSYGDQNRNSANILLEGGLRSSSNTHGRSLPQTYQQSFNRAPTSRTEMTARTVPIASLNPYISRWTIKARVTSKKDLRQFTNARGEGKVFSFDLLDSDGGEIQVTCFNAAADQFYNMIEAGRVYLISSGALKTASKNFNHLNNDYSIHLESTSIVQPCLEDDFSIPMQLFHFRSISDIENMENNSILDVIGVVSSITLTASIMRKDGKETLKKTLQLKDESGRSVELTLWGDFCNLEGKELQDKCDKGHFPILAVKGGRISDFNGKSVGTLSSSQLFVEPDFPEARKLREWFDKEGKDKPAVSVSRGTVGTGRMDVRKTISQIKDENLGTSDKPDWITVHATILYIKSDSFCYTACPRMSEGRQCSKKVTNDGDGQWRCEKCDKSSVDCDYRYILSFQIQDHTGLTWVTAFQECAEEIIGVPAKELYHLKNVDDEKMAEIIKGVLFTQYLFKLKVKEETYSDENRVKSTVVKAEKLDVSRESMTLLDMLDKFAEDPNASFGRTSNGAVKSEMESYDLGAASIIVGNISANRENRSPADYVGQYRNQNNSGGTGAGVYISCLSCGVTGHRSSNCPRVNNNGPGQPMRSGSTGRYGVVSMQRG